MQKNRLDILSTRPLSPDIIKEAENQNIFIECISFIETEPVKTDELKEKLQKISKENITAVFTSKNAVEAVKEYLAFAPNWQVFSIGHTTRELISKVFGETSIIATANDASSLAEVIIEKEIKEIVFFCGDQRRDELPGKLKAEKIKVEELIVYKTNETAKKISKDYNGILFFSPSAVNSFFLENKIDNNLTLFAIGNTTADAIKQKVNNKIIIADQPGKEALVKKAIAYFTNLQGLKNNE